MRRKLLLFVLLFPWVGLFVGATAFFGGPWSDLKAKAGIRKFMVGECVRVGPGVYEVYALGEKGYSLRLCSRRSCGEIFLQYGHEFEDYYESVPCPAI